jgi:transposase-like protein
MKPTFKTPAKREKGSILEPHFTDEDKAREYLEAVRWPDGAICPHCGLIGEAYKLTPKVKEPVEVDYQTKDELKKQRVRKPRKGLWKCAGCRKQLTVTVKTIFEDSHIPLHKWLLAIHLLCSSKKGMSAHQLMRMLDIRQYKSAWFMAHRIRYAMTGELPEKMNGIVECDETFVGGKAKNKHKSERGGYAATLGVRAQDRKSPTADKLAVFSVLERGGRIHSRHIGK